MLLEAAPIPLGQIEQQVPIDLLRFLRQILAHDLWVGRNQLRGPQDAQIPHVERAKIDHPSQIAARIALVLVADARCPGHAGVGLLLQDGGHRLRMATAEGELAKEPARIVTPLAQLVVGYQEA